MNNAMVTIHLGCVHFPCIADYVIDHCPLSHSERCLLAVRFHDRRLPRAEGKPYGAKTLQSEKGIWRVPDLFVEREVSTEVRIATENFLEVFL